MVSLTRRPSDAGTSSSVVISRPTLFTMTRRSPSAPISILLYAFSTPDCPTTDPLRRPSAAICVSPTSPT